MNKNKQWTVHTLFKWLGNRDIENIDQGQNAAIVLLATKSEIPFDKIVILSNKDEEKRHSFKRFLKKRMAMISRPSDDIKIHLAQFQSPIDYQSIYNICGDIFKPFDALEVGLTETPVEKGSTLITCIAESFDCIGNVAFADRKVSFNQQMNALTLKREVVSDWFIYSLILLLKKLIQNASTSSIKGGSKSKLEEVELTLPPLEKQKEFEMIFNEQIKLKQKMNQSFLGNSTKFDSLSQKAFAGEL